MLQSVFNMQAKEKENLAKLAKIVYYFQKKRYEKHPTLHYLDEVKRARMDCGAIPDDKDVCTDKQFDMIKKSTALTRYFLNCKIEQQFNASVLCYKKCK